ncbi:MAG: hypothetical protein ACOX36_02350 [Saccharofermentanales bacterium]|jgi:hypothetical protein
MMFIKNGTRIGDNIFCYDILFRLPERLTGTHCFIIGHHIQSEQRIRNIAEKLHEGGFYYFNIFGQHCDLWKSALISTASNDLSTVIEASPVAREEMCEELATHSTLVENTECCVIADDDMFLDYLIKDTLDILDGIKGFPPLWWKRFRDGMEFIYNGKDCIVSISDSILIGELGQEKSFDCIFIGFREPLFDGKSFNDVWSEISGLSVKW